MGSAIRVYVGNFALNHGGVSGYFATYGIGMIAVFAALTVVQRHIARATAT